MDFKPAMSFPLPAKILLGTGSLLILAASFAVYGIVLRLRRRKAGAGESTTS